MSAPVDMATARSRVVEIVAAVTRTRLDGLDALVDVSRATVEDWDSLAHVEILFTVEEEFDIEFDETAMRNSTDVDQIAAEIVRLTLASR